MSFDAHKNFAVSRVAIAPIPALSGLGLIVALGEGTRFPATPFNATVGPPGVIFTPLNAEIIRVTAVVGDTLTFLRAQEGTSPRAILVGDLIFAAITAKTFTDVESAVSAMALPQAGQTLAMAAGTDVTFNPPFPNLRNVIEGDYAVSVLGKDSNGIACNVNWVKTPLKLTLFPDFDDTIVDWTATPRTQ